MDNLQTIRIITFCQVVIQSVPSHHNKLCLNVKKNFYTTCTSMIRETQLSCFEFMCQFYQLDTGGHTQETKPVAMRCLPKANCKELNQMA